MTSLKIFPALLVAFMATRAYGESAHDKPLKGFTTVDPHAAVTLTLDDGTPLIINPEGNGLMRGSGTPTTLGVVEGSRIPIPRAPDGSCPDVDAILTHAIDAPATIFDPAEGERPHSLLAATTRAELNHTVDDAACEIVVTRARGYVAYRKVVIKNHLKGKDRRDLQADGFFDEPIYPDVPLPTPTSDPSRAAVTPPPGVPDNHPAFRATTWGTIEPVPVSEPRHVTSD